MKFLLVLSLCVSCNAFFFDPNGFQAFQNFHEHVLQQFQNTYWEMFQYFQNQFNWNFDLFKYNFVQKYTNLIERQRRWKIVLNNMILIGENYARFSKGEVTYKLGPNQFLDMDHSEIMNQMMGYDMRAAQESTPGQPFRAEEGVSYPAEKDWRAEGAVTRVKDQQHCGSCWAFSATGALEGQLQIKTRRLIPLSEQNLVDCTSTYGEKGCYYGFTDRAFQYVTDYGIESEACYPYEERVGNCRRNENCVITKAQGYVNIGAGNEADLLAAVATKGPVSVGVSATLQSFAFYISGIYNDPMCDPRNITHAMLVVGYGTDRGTDYWLLKNSWGQSWGEHGYMRLARNKNQCGVATQASYPVI